MFLQRSSVVIGIPVAPVIVEFFTGVEDTGLQTAFFSIIIIIVIIIIIIIAPKVQ